MIDATGTKCRPRAFATKLKIARQSQMIENEWNYFQKSGKLLRPTFLLSQFLGLGDDRSYKNF